MGAQQTFCSVAMDCITHFFRSDKPHIIATIFFKKEYKVWRVPRFSRAFIDTIKDFSSFNALKMFDTTNRFALYVLNLYSESFSTFCSSCRDNFSTTFSFHSCSKTVCSFSWCAVGLVCSFHRELSL